MTECCYHNMDYIESIQYIKSIQSGAKIKPGLETIRSLLGLLGNPQDKLSFVHIAGTNGKGSTAAFISSVLAESGQKVGRYVSPAVFSEGEKIQWIQGEKTHSITEAEFAHIMTGMRQAVETMREQGKMLPTEFEIETVVAFLAFEKWNCDMVVLETGMGGRLDATNVVQNVVCTVITPVSMDHMKFLGNTIEEIAEEKAGIIKPRVPVITFQKIKAAEDRIVQSGREKKAEVICVRKEDITITQTGREGSVFRYGPYVEMKISMTGAYQVENAALALSCLDCLRKKYRISDEQIKEGMVRAHWHGRFDVLQRNPVVVVDGAHNPDGMVRFLESVHLFYGDLKKIGIMGVFADKDYETMCREIQGTFQKIYTVTPPAERGLPAEKLALQLNQCGERAEAVSSIREAVRKALEDSVSGEDGIFVFGSLSFLKEVYGCFPSLAVPI